MYELNNKAILLSRNGKLDKAITLFKEALKDSPEDSNINFNIALVYIKKEQFETAILYLKTSIELSPCDDNLREMGVCYIRLQDYPKARTFLIKAVTEFGSSESENALGVLFFKISHFETAKRHFDHAIKLNKYNSDAWFNLKDTCTELGMKKEAKMALYQFNLLEKQ